MLSLTRWVPGILVLLSLTTACASEVQPTRSDPAQADYVPLDDTALETLLGPIALYPDDLLAIVLPASTYPLQIVQAARFRERTPDATPDERWDDSVVALLNYPEVLKLLNDDLDWTWRLGEAVINQQADVLAAVTAFRERAQLAGNLKSDDKQIVEVREKIVYIRPVSERVIYVPYYDPWEVTTYRSRRVYHYYPSAYPVYYYPYDDGYRFPHDSFWGVSTWFNIGWQHHRLHNLHYGYRQHPYYGHTYRDRDRRHTWRHRRPHQDIGHGVDPRDIDPGAYPPNGTHWYPRQGYGARPFGNRRYRGDHPRGRPATQTDLPSSGNGATDHPPPPPGQPGGTPGDSGADEAPVVYEGNINGEQIRVIRRGSHFDTTSGNLPGRPGVESPSPTPGPSDLGADAPITGDPDATREAAIRDAIMRARQQANDRQHDYSRHNQAPSERRDWRQAAPVGADPGNGQIVDDSAIQRAIQDARARADRDNRFESSGLGRRERRAEVYSQPNERSGPAWRTQDPVQSQPSQPAWEDNPAVQEARSRAREYGSQIERLGSHGSGFGDRARNEAPAQESRPEPAPPPAPVQLPEGIPEIRY